MSYYYEADTYELKAKLSKYLRALKMGWADFIAVKRYGRTCAFIYPIRKYRDIPALPPRSEEDLRFYTSAKFYKDGSVSRRELAEQQNKAVIK